jgi:hypothetical protein
VRKQLSFAEVIIETVNRVLAHYKRGEWKFEKTEMKWNEMVEELLTVCGGRRRSPLRFPVRFWFIRSVLSWILKWLQSKFLMQEGFWFGEIAEFSCFRVLIFLFFLTKNGFYLLCVFYFCFWWMMICLLQNEVNSIIIK